MARKIMRGASRRRRLALFCLIGAGLLVASVAGTGRFLGGTHASVDTGSRVDDPFAGRRVVCFGHVDMEQGVTPLYPVIPGRVTAVPARETEEVKAGAVLVQVDDSLARLRVQEAEADLEASEEQLAQAQKLPEQHQVKVTQQEAAIEAVEQRLSGARLVLARKRELEKAQYLNAKEADASESMVRELEALERVERGKLRELQLVDPYASVKRARAEVEAKRSRLEQARKGEAECVLRAPADGTVLRVLVNPGEVLGPQAKQPAVLFCPEGRRLIRAEVEQEFAGRVGVGQFAAVEDDTTAGATWRGKVLRVSDWYTHRRSILQEPFQFNDVRTLECLIALDPNQSHLRIGQRVRVTIVQPEK